MKSADLSVKYFIHRKAAGQSFQTNIIMNSENMTELKELFRAVKKLIIELVMLTVLVSSAQIFSVESVLNQLVLRQIRNAYNCTAVVFESNHENAVFTEIPDEVIQLIENDPRVVSVSRRYTYAAWINDIEAVPSHFAKPSIRELLVFSGVINHVSGHSSKAGDIYKHSYSVMIEEVYAGVKDVIFPGKIIPVIANFTDKEKYDAFSVEEGQRFLFFAVTRNMKNGKTDGLFDDQQIIVNHGMNPSAAYSTYLLDECFTGETIVPLPSDASDDEIDAIVRQELMNRNIADVTQAVKDTAHQFTVHTVRNMNELMAMVSEQMFITEGNAITDPDYGEKKCVISSLLAQKNSLSVGDTLEIRIGDSAYITDGYESGVPGYLHDCGKVQYGTSEKYTIAGIYDFIRLDALRDYSQSYGYNDIFIPEYQSLIQAGKHLTPYSYSFSVDGCRYEEFVDDFMPELERLGYSMVISSGKWEQVQSVFDQFSMREAVLRKYIFPVLILVSMIMILIVIVMHLNEFALRRIMGERFISAAKAVLIPYAFMMIISVLLGSAFSYVYAKTVLLKQAGYLILRDIATSVYFNGWISLLCIIALHLITVLIVLRKADRKSLLKIVNRGVK